MDTNSLAHTTWNCKYHIVFAPKYRRKIIYGELKQDIANILSMLSKRKEECGSNHVFVTVTGPARKLTHHSSFRTAARFRDTEGHDKPAHDGLHILRRTFASALLKAGASVSQIASALGHTDMGSVDRYLAVEKEKMRKCALSIVDLPYKGGMY